MEPQIIDRNQMLRKLGQGEMGAVYEAKNLEPGRRVAVKVIGPLQARGEGRRRRQHAGSPGDDVRMRPSRHRVRNPMRAYGCAKTVAAWLVALCSLEVSLEAGALAQPAPPVSAPLVQDDKDVEANRSEARSYFEQGLALFQKEAWDAALAEFVRSRRIYPTRAATENAALCLRQLRRLDEALEMFEDMLKFSNLTEAKRKTAEAAIAELKEQIGTLRIEGAEAGASIVVDGRYRGTLPLAGPLRVGAGAHEIRAFKEGSDPFGTTIEVKGKEEAVVQLRSLSTGGRLKVTEQHERVLEVVVDGSLVGKTPWEGPLSVGEHLITLRGSLDLDAIPECAPGNEGAGERKRAAPRGSVELGTQPVSVPIRLREVTKLTLMAESLDTSLRVEPMPGGASVSIDSVVVGRGSWEGRLRVGEHRVEVTADGFLPQTRRVSLEREKRLVVKIDMERDRSAAGFQTTRNAAAGSAFAVGALGLGVGAVAGALALGKIHEVESRCVGFRCPPSERANVSAAGTLGNVSTVGLVVGGIGVAVGSIILVSLRTGATAPGRASAALRLGVGRVDFEGRF
ncbi:MAG: PEGA domain-containing protein [Byssovorax sp.]